MVVSEDDEDTEKKDWKTFCYFWLIPQNGHSTYIVVDIKETNKPKQVYINDLAKPELIRK